MKSWLILMLVCGFVFVGGCAQEQKVQGVKVERSSKSLESYRGEAIEVIRQSLSDTNEIMRAAGIEAVVAGDLGELMPKVVQMTKDESAAVRFSAAVAIGDMKYQRGELSVSNLRKDENANVRLAMEYVKVKFGRGGVGAIVLALESADQGERANAAMLLGKIGNVNAAKSLYGMLESQDSVMEVKIQATEAIAMLGIESVYQRLWTLLISKYADDRIAGIRGMTLLKTGDARNAIVTMLHDDVLEVRLYAAERLGSIGDASGEYVVLEYLQGENGKKGMMSAGSSDDMAVMAIGKIGSDELKGYLSAYLKNRSRKIRLRAAESIAVLTAKK